MDLAGLFGYGPAAMPLSTQSAPASIMDGSHCLDTTDAWFVDAVYSYVAQSMPKQCFSYPLYPGNETILVLLMYRVSQKKMPGKLPGK